MEKMKKDLSSKSYLNLDPGVIDFVKVFFPSYQILDSFTPREREELVKSLNPEERVRGLNPEERVKGLNPEERVRGLNPEERIRGLKREELLKCLKRMK